MAIPTAILLTILSGVDLESVGYPNPAATSTDLALFAGTYQHRVTSQVEKLHAAPFHWLTEARYFGQ